MLTDRFGRLLAVSVAIGATTSMAGAYFSFFLNGATGGVIVSLQTLLFLAAFVFAPKHGLIASRRGAVSEETPMTELWNFVAVPLSYEFMQRALVVAVWSVPSARCCPVIWFFVAGP